MTEEEKIKLKENMKKLYQFFYEKYLKPYMETPYPKRPGYLKSDEIRAGLRYGMKIVYHDAFSTDNPDLPLDYMRIMNPQSYRLREDLWKTILDAGERARQYKLRRAV